MKQLKNELLLAEFLKNGGAIKKLPPSAKFVPKDKRRVGMMQSGIPFTKQKEILKALDRDYEEKTRNFE